MSFFAWTCLHIFLATLNDFLVLLEGWGAMASTIACCGHFPIRLLYLLSYGKRIIIFFKLALCHFTFMKFESNLMQFIHQDIPHQDKIANFLLYSVPLA